MASINKVCLTNLVNYNVNSRTGYPNAIQRAIQLVSMLGSRQSNSTFLSSDKLFFVFLLGNLFTLFFPFLSSPFYLNHFYYPFLQTFYKIDMSLYKVVDKLILQNCHNCHCLCYIGKKNLKYTLYKEFLLLLEVNHLTGQNSQICSGEGSKIPYQRIKQTVAESCLLLCFFKKRLGYLNYF